jgi:uridylate kinase
MTLTHSTPSPIYQRVLLKLSGESLLGNHSSGIDPAVLGRISENIAELIGLGISVGIVIGGGNFLRGALMAKVGFDRITCDQMGMLATVMNGLVLRDSFIQAGMRTNVMSPVAVQGVVETYDRSRALGYLKNGHVVIFVGGTGSPLFSTDSAASLRSIEMQADVILKATKVDGIYSDDPIKNPKAKHLDFLTYQEVIEQQLGVMDLAAICLCRDHHMPIRIFNMHEPHILKRVALGEKIGSLIS